VRRSPKANLFNAIGSEGKNQSLRRRASPDPRHGHDAGVVLTATNTLISMDRAPSTELSTEAQHASVDNLGGLRSGRAR
jgi:hypothetical protein